MTATASTSAPVRQAPAPETTYGFAPDDGPGVEDIELERVTSTGWRLIDGRLPKNDPFRLLGFLEHSRRLYEVMELGDGFEWSTFHSFEEAVAHIAGNASDTARRRMKASSLTALHASWRW